MGPFPLVDVPERPQDTPEDIIGDIPPDIRATVTYNPRQMIAPRDVTARSLKEAVWYAFEAIGGNSSLAIWAAANPTKFFTLLFARMLPQASTPVMQDNSEVTFKLNVPLKTLDVIEHTQHHEGN